MSAPKSYEVQILAPIEKLLANMLHRSKNDSFELRLQILESAASRLGRFKLEHYFEAFGISPAVSFDSLDQAGKQLVEALSPFSIHPAMVLSALAREPLSLSDQRAAGAYNTDFRLALHLAELAKRALNEVAKVLDPACGTGILLVAVALAVCGSDRRKLAQWLANSVYAADLSPLALRGARLALASFTDDIETIQAMWSHWRVQDSLMAEYATWNELSSDLFDLVIGNPPWEKLKLTRHEYLSAAGQQRHYGADYENIDSDGYDKQRRELEEYAQILRSRYSLLGTGEPDLYMAFVQLFSELVRRGGRVAVLVPAGLIRSQGTEELRRYLYDNGHNITITVMENRARFFPIDTRFKFLSICYMRREKGVSTRDPIHIRHATGTATDVKLTGGARLDRGTLSVIRPDLTVPEVRNNREWRIFITMIKNGHYLQNNESKWYPEFFREVDMSRQRTQFLRNPKAADLPVIEGRMIQAHRFGAKMYLSGSGRRAIWSHTPKGKTAVVPQFWIEPNNLSPKAAQRTKMLRAGFCDIAGQTNERSMMAALIPPGVVCGNKVPTLIFPNEQSESRLLLWLGIVNSLPYDWMLRRVLTTTVNYFMLLGLPLPKLEPEDLPGRYIVNESKELHGMNSQGTSFDQWRNAELRANIDIAVLVAFGLGYKELSLMLEDFPLLDRGQPPIFGEVSSTITRDYLMLCAAKRFGIPAESLAS
ncbi:MAG: Type restriction enzyme methylase subunit, partial [Bacilli bacterium]|nr:Type restriction enzyme methylase subunit [Bacilli bacterium]